MPHWNVGRKHTPEHIAKTRRPLSANGRWKGGRSNTKEGYIRIKMLGHPNATLDGYVLEHRLVMERVLGRLLLPTELVHHKNSIKDDNRPENLAVLSHAEHQREERLGKRFKYGARVAKQCRHCLNEFLF